MIVLTCVRDTVANRYFAPSAAVNTDVAQRNFADLVNMDNHFERNAKDYDLVFVGYFDENTGEIVSNDHVVVCNGLDVVEVKKNGV